MMKSRRVGLKRALFLESHLMKNVFTISLDKYNWRTLVQTKPNEASKFVKFVKNRNRDELNLY